MFRDLDNPTWMYLKVILFLVVLALSCGSLVLSAPNWRTVVLLALVVWSSSRLYYFFFYVIEKYIDPSFRFSGVGAAVAYILRKRRNE